MTAIGRALLTRPKLLVLDEPSMGLAPIAVQAIFNALRLLNESEGLSILVAEQNSTVALRFAHRVSILETGATVLEGTAQELAEREDLKSFYLGGKSELLPQQHRINNRVA
jgi:branched-chain amino acid transport system ATP-binding protein